MRAYELPKLLPPPPAVHRNHLLMTDTHTHTHQCTTNEKFCTKNHSHQAAAAALPPARHSPQTIYHPRGSLICASNHCMQSAFRVRVCINFDVSKSVRQLDSRCGIVNSSDGSCCTCARGVVANGVERWIAFGTYICCWDCYLGFCCCVF